MRRRRGPGLRGASLQVLLLLEESEQLVLAVKTALLEVLHLVLDRLQLLRVRDAPVEETLLLGDDLL